MNNLTQDEQELILLVRNLNPYEKVEIRLKENKIGNVTITHTSHYRKEFSYKKLDT